MLEAQIGRQRRAHALDVVVDQTRLVERVGRGRALDVQLDGLEVAANGDLVILVEATAHARDIADVDLLAGPKRSRLDRPDRRRVGRQPEAANLLLEAALHRAERQVLRMAGDAGADVGEREVEPTQGRRRDLDPDFLVAGAEHLDPIDADRQQLVAQPLGQLLESGLG